MVFVVSEIFFMCQHCSSMDQGSPSKRNVTNEMFEDINPFDTEPVAKIAVKMGIMRVVKFMSSPGNDFTS